MTPDPELLGDEPVRLGRRRDPDDRESEFLDAEPAPLWRPPRWLVVAVALVAVLATVGWYVDRQDRAGEERALDGCRRALHNAVVFSNLRMMAMADYLRPAISSTSGVERGQIADLMSQPARSVLRDVERADRVCRAVSIHPWHVSLAARRDAFTAYADGVAHWVRAVATEGRTYYGNNATLQRLRDDADIGVIGGPF